MLYKPFNTINTSDRYNNTDYITVTSKAQGFQIHTVSVRKY